MNADRKLVGSSGFRVGGSLGLDGATLPKIAPHGGEGPISGRLTPRLGLESRGRTDDCLENAVWVLQPALSGDWGRFNSQATHTKP